LAFWTYVRLGRLPSQSASGGFPLGFSCFGRGRRIESPLQFREFFCILFNANFQPTDFLLEILQLHNTTRLSASDESRETDQSELSLK
jgi:hypothetical protein